MALALQSLDTFPETTTVDLLGVACGRGAGDARCEAGPGALRCDGLDIRLAGHGIRARWGGMLRAPRLHVPALTAIEVVCETLAAGVAESVARGAPFAVLGGDHSIAAGTWSGAAAALGARRPLGLVWIDAHMDSHLPATSPSGALHGMVLAALLGHGPAALTGLARPGPAVRPAHVCLVGVRSFEAAEAALLAALGVRVFLMGEVAARGLGPVLAEALAIAGNGTAGFGVSIDLDALDPEDAPGVGSPVPGGLAGGGLIEALAAVGRAPGLLGVEIVEFNPARDREGRTARLIADLLAVSLPTGGVS